MWKDRIDAAAAGGPRVTYESLVDDYLSEAHRNYPGMGCPVSALAGDLARSDKRTRAVATRKIRDNIELLATLIRDTNKTDKDTARSRAVMTYCAMLGAISMARAVSDKERAPLHLHCQDANREEVEQVAASREPILENLGIGLNVQYPCIAFHPVL